MSAYLRSRRNFAHRSERRQVPGADSCTAAKKRPLLDHLIGNGEERWRHGEAEHRGGLGVDYQLELA
jgi:hypothetical protein